MESAFGYISVLPGAFSAYRYTALQNDPMGHGPLHSYLKGETMHGGKHDADIFSSNMYLAEDRILCWELVTKRDSAWLLRFVKRAQAETDVPTHVAELISQRRRWLNGSFFAAIHSIIKFGRIYSQNTVCFGSSCYTWRCCIRLLCCSSLGFHWRTTFLFSIFWPGPWRILHAGSMCLP